MWGEEKTNANNNNSNNTNGYHDSYSSRGHGYAMAFPPPPYRDLLSLLCFSPRSPPDIQHKIFGEYLTLFDIGRLDTALHGRHLREAMLPIWRRRREGDEEEEEEGPVQVQVPVLVLHADGGGGGGTMSSDCLRWISLRGLSIGQLKLGGNIEDGDFDDFDINLDYIKLLHILEGCELSAMTLIDIARKCVRARELRIDRFYFEENDFVSMLENLPRNLIKLEISSIRVTNKMLEAIPANFPRLEHFILQPYRTVVSISSAGLILIFSSCIHLREINLMGVRISHHVNDDVLISISQHCPQLSILHIYLSDDVTDVGISALAEGCCCGMFTDLELESFDEENCLFTDSSLVKLFQRQKLIKRLSIHIPTMTDISMISIAENCKQLEYLHLDFMLHVTDISMMQIGQQCKYLKKINFVYIPGITDVSMVAISQHCHQLEELILYECPSILDISMLQIGQQCKSLKEIMFTRMEGVTDVSMVAISQHCHQLEKLIFYDCPSISDISMQAVAENCRNLIYLELIHMPGLVNPSYIADIARNNIRLKYNGIGVAECGELYKATLKEMLQAITAGR